MRNATILIPSVQTCVAFLNARAEEAAEGKEGKEEGQEGRERHLLSSTPKRPSHILYNHILVPSVRPVVAFEGPVFK